MHGLKDVLSPSCQEQTAFSLAVHSHSLAHQSSASQGSAQHLPIHSSHHPHDIVTHKAGLAHLPRPKPAQAPASPGPRGAQACPASNKGSVHRPRQPQKDKHVKPQAGRHIVSHARKGT